jgi:hypothetical protein
MYYGGYECLYEFFSSGFDTEDGREEARESIGSC